ncbi:hypothetical protein, partial [Micromonospora sp. WMMD736]|uniref:hypothetical protein n=1 Tax=Micromonospora sp. WMMD736 TaxID=3404112 RepID=UPI003B9224B8
DAAPYVATAYSEAVLSRILIGALGAVGAVAIGAPGMATAEPAPPPAPNINAYAPVKPSEYAVMDNAWYAFSTPDGLTCVLQRSGGYGCSGPIPGAPDGANLVSGGPGTPGWSNTAGPLFGNVGEVKPLPAHSRISYQTVSCGTDGVMTSCVNARDHSGFVISPGGSYLLTNNPMLDRSDVGGNWPF